MGRSPVSLVAQAPYRPSCLPFPHKQSLSRSRALSEKIPGWRTKLLDGVRRPEAHTAHKHRVPDSMGKGNCALLSPSLNSLAS